MKAARCILAGFSLMLLAGCVVRDDRGGPDRDRGRGEFHDQDRGPQQGHGPERGGEQDHERGDRR
jgi:hypothetical protein